jgi:2-polyprenyl-3-methyl-5-hydroxy-6-metoxy-1,4-benzoquinol methylase
MPSEPSTAGASGFPLVKRSCPICGSEAFRVYGQKQALRLVRCDECSMIFATPVPADYLSGRFYDQSGAEYYVSAAKLESDYAPVRFERELKLFRKYCPGGAILDVGCSSGAFLHQLKERFPKSYEGAGTDASGPALEYARSRGVIVHHGDFLQQTFGERKFDAVTLWAVLEHLANPRAFLQRAWTLLNPGGLCFVLVPNMDSLAFRILGLRYRYVYPQHLNYFTKKTLTRLAADRFNILQSRSTHFNPIVIFQDWRSAGKEITSAERGELLKRTTGYKQNRLLKPVRELYRLSENMLGKLNLADNLVLVLKRKESEQNPVNYSKQLLRVA